MSHFARHLPSTAGGNPRIGLIGGAVVGATLFGFFAYLNRSHERKLELDRAGKPSSISSWESRMINQTTATDSPTSITLRASRVENRSTPIPSVKTEHNAKHRTVSQERDSAVEYPLTSSGKRIYEVPTAQREGRDGFVYTKAPDWTKTSTTGKRPKDSRDEIKILKPIS